MSCITTCIIPQQRYWLIFINNVWQVTVAVLQLTAGFESEKMIYYTRVEWCILLSLYLIIECCSRVILNYLVQIHFDVLIVPLHDDIIIWGEHLKTCLNCRIFSSFITKANTEMKFSNVIHHVSIHKFKRYPSSINLLRSHIPSSKADWAVRAIIHMKAI